MERFIACAKLKCLKFKLSYKMSIAEAIKAHPRRGTILVENKGKMVILKVTGDGNCQFRSVGLMISGMDDDENQRKLRMISVAEYLKIDEKVLKKSLCFTHHEKDCLSQELCNREKEHVGAVIQSSARPFKRFVSDKTAFAREMQKEKTWGNEYSIKALAQALNIKVNLIQKNLKTSCYGVTNTYCPGGDCEVNILYDGFHYETLVPRAWDLTLTGERESSPHAKPSVGNPRKRKLCKSKEKNRKTSKFPFSFKDWHEDQRKKLSEDVDEIYVSDVSNESSHEKTSGLDRKLTGESSPQSIPSDDSDPESNVILSKRRPLESKMSWVEGERDNLAKSVPNTHLKDVDVEPRRKVENISGENSPQGVSDEGPPDSSSGSEEDCNGNKRQERDRKNLPKDKTAEVKKSAKVRQPSILSMLVKSKLLEKKDVHLNKSISRENSPPVQKVRDEDSDGDDCDEQESVKEIGKKKNKKRKCVVRSDWFQPQPNGENKDVNGDNVNTYLRRVGGNKYLVACHLCCHSVSVEYKGFSAIQDHAKTRKHKQRIEEGRGNKNMGIYVEKKRDNCVIDAEIKLTRFAGVHNVSLRTTVPHLVKLCKSIFPDSAICQEMSSLSAGRLYYGMKEGLGKTEVRITVKDLLDTPFSLQMDGGLKGGKHRLNFIVRYYSMDTGKCVEKFIIAKTTIHETAAVVANCFLDWCEVNKVNIQENLIMINSDHAATLRGSRIGAVTKISEIAPNVATCDIGGDFLHDLNNSTKIPFYKTFPDVIKLLDITRQDFNKSAKKEEHFLEICSELGLPTTKPQVWARSRFLARYECVQERRKRIAAYSEYYSSVDIEPRRKKRKVENISGENSPQGVSDEDNGQSSSSEDDGGSEEETRKPKRKKLKWLKKKFNPGEELNTTTLELEVAQDCLNSSHVLLKVFQMKKPMIHVLKPTMLQFVKDSFLEITPSKFLKHSDGKPFGGKSLKLLEFETEEERIHRRAKDKEIEIQIKDLKLEKIRLEIESAAARGEKIKYNIKKMMTKVDKELQKLKAEQSSGKFALLYEPEQITLSKAVRETIKGLTQNKIEKQSFEIFAKSKKLEFYHNMCRKIQKTFPLDNNLLTKLVYIDPAKVDDEKTEDAFKEICDQMPQFIKEENDDVISQLRSLRLNKSDFDKEKYDKYLKEVKDDSIPFKDIDGIDELWSPIIRNQKYASLGRFLKAVLSFIHSTASVEGSIKDIRNVLGSMSHKSSDKMCTSRLAVMSSVRSGKSDCCYDFECTQEYRDAWKDSWKISEEEAIEEVEHDDTDTDNDNN